MKVLVYVTLKSDVLDPQGNAILKACRALGHPGVRSVRQGKLFEVVVDASDEEGARGVIAEISDKLLANTVIEDFQIERIEP